MKKILFFIITLFIFSSSLFADYVLGSESDLTNENVTSYCDSKNPELNFYANKYYGVYEPYSDYYGGLSCESSLSLISGTCGSTVGHTTYFTVLISTPGKTCSSGYVSAKKYARKYILKQKPTCADGEYFDVNLEQCINPDNDGDGILNECDPDNPDFENLDCDSDNILNGVDSDIDGDGILNGNDSNPYVNDSDSSSEDSSKVCPATALTMTPVKDEASCSMSNPLFTVPDGELRYVSYVMWDDCRKSCMADVLTCPYGQAIKDGRCQSVVPDVDDCLGRSVCRIISFGVSPNVSCFKSCDCLTVEHPVPDSTTGYFYEEVSCANIKDDASELDDLRLNDDTNKTLPTDLLIDSNASADLDVSASMKVALESYAASKESTQLDLLSESKIQSLQLVSANSKLTDIESSLKNFSAVATSNQKVIGDSLDSINVGVVNSNNLLGQLVDGQDTGNTLLEDIKGLITDLNTSSDGDSNVSGDYTESDGQATDRGNIDGSLSEFYTFLDNITNDFNNMKSMLDGGLSASSMSSGSAPEFCAVVFGKQLCINLCDSFGQFYSVFYYIFTALFLFAALKIYYLAFKMRV
ncbi:hypothetical protein [Sulfurimonas xiamenensis]|uniref:Thrombospondin type 3 repeat-containing protein n=1 Tax=Sulfurimonas xiamenensis TaxID=2590021 RepID=A0AAJ4A4G8_9BACT|nr:hypothetical protein [Sulfurimonas xiamenensis]QFR43618.1 hypothetical protein FJR47_06720 [Sulfurimonas xiamenensis]